MGRTNDFLKRRDFLKEIGLGTMGMIAFGQAVFSEARSHWKPSGRPKSVDQLYKKVVEPARVSLVKGNDRRQIVFQSLEMIEDEVLASIGNKKIVIKPNIVLSNRPLAVTHIDAVRAVLDFLAPHYEKQIIIGESGVQNTWEGFKNNGYFALEKEYKVKVIDLNRDSYQYWYVFGEEMRPIAVRIINTFLDPDVYLVSVARMKTHDTVLVTLSLKNVIMASPLNDYKKNDKGLLHAKTKSVNDICHFNIFHLAQKVYPDLAIIDGFEAMEGNGPGDGTPFDSRVALAGRDALALDTIATRVMGFDPKRILYLSAMTEARIGQGEVEKINVIGTPLDQCLYKFKPHEKMAEIYKL